MARDIFQMTISQPDINGMLIAYAGIEIRVMRRGGDPLNNSDLVSVYQRPTGASEGPTPESGAPQGYTNPFVTGDSGSVEFWANGPAELDIHIKDTHTPTRIAERTMGWNAFVAAVGSVPTSMLASDAGLTLGTLAAEVLRQVTQIGQVIDWWRPNNTVPLPAGFVVCDGQQVPAGQHEFPGVAGAINVPDLRNMFIIGADPTKPYQQGANQGDVQTTDAPGIGGTGGSNRAKNFAHGHGVPGVDHLHTTADHLHSVGGLYTGNHYHTPGNIYSDGHNRVFAPSYGSGEAAAFANSISGMGGGNTDWSGNLGIYGATGAADRPLTTSGSDRSLSTATNSTTWTLDPGTDVRPRFTGLLKLMKVRRA